MSKIIEEQLKKCVYADLSNYDPTTRTYKIPKYTKPRFEVGKCYVVKIPKEEVGNTSSVLATNWNHGTAPGFDCCKVFVNKAVGKNIYVDCLAYDFENKRDLSEMWSGWLDISTLKQLAVL